MLGLLNASVLVALVGLNAFFVLAEYSLLRMRRTRLQQLIAEGNTRALLIQGLLADTSVLFSGIQLGITVVSLLMGWLGEQIIAQALLQLLEGHLHRHLSLAIAHSVAVALAFLLVTTVVMVLGELVPKTLAYERAEHVALAVARPIAFYFRVTRYPVQVLDRVSSGALRLLRPEPSSHGPMVTPEEVKLIVSAIRQGGLLEEEQEEMIHSVFDLHRVRVREIMLPWAKVTCLPVTASLSEVLEAVVNDQHSRVPIYEETRDNVVGILYTKDLLAVLQDRQRLGIPFDSPFDLRSVLHQPMIVPETMTLNQMLEEARPRHAQVALVVDEFGTFVGLVTLEDVLEQIVGKIEDEYDRGESATERVSDNVIAVDGALSLRELADEHGIELPRGAGYETLAGFVLDRLGAVPRGGETVTFENRRYTVIEMEGRRVSRVRVEKLPEPAAQQRPRQASPVPALAPRNQ
ncbi:MAG TPA: hemolysin family protein [Terriglobia bacterium]